MFQKAMQMLRFLAKRDCETVFNVSVAQATFLLRMLSQLSLAELMTKTYSRFQRLATAAGVVMTRSGEFRREIRFSQVDSGHDPQRSIA